MLEGQKHFAEPPGSATFGRRGLMTAVTADQRTCLDARCVGRSLRRSAIQVRPKCIRRVDGGRRLYRVTLRRRSEPVFSSSATHLTWCVIVKTPVVLNVSANLCGRLRARAQTSP
jgi:hypothetical protein